VPCLSCLTPERSASKQTKRNEEDNGRQDHEKLQYEFMTVKLSASDSLYKKLAQLVC